MTESKYLAVVRRTGQKKDLYLASRPGTTSFVGIFLLGSVDTIAFHFVQFCLLDPSSLASFDYIPVTCSPSRLDIKDTPLLFLELMSNLTEIVKKVLFYKQIFV